MAVADAPTGPFHYLGSLRPNAGVWPENSPFPTRRPLGPDQAGRLADFDLPGGPVPYYPKHILYRRDFAGEQMARDMTLFVDDDGRGYHIYASDENGTLHSSLLSDGYLRPAGRYLHVFPGAFSDAPAVFKHEGRYLLIGANTACSPCDRSYFPRSK